MLLVALPIGHDMRVMRGKVTLHDRRIPPLADGGFKPGAVGFTAIVEQCVGAMPTGEGLHLCKFALLRRPDTSKPPRCTG
jgi:hypothetical protein